MEYPAARSARPVRGLGWYLLFAAAIHLLIFLAVPASWFQQGFQRSSGPLLKMEITRPATPPGRVGAPPDAISAEQVIARAVEEAGKNADAPTGSFYLDSQRGALRSSLSQAPAPAAGEVLETFTGPHGPRAVLRRRSGEMLCFMATPVHDGSGESVLFWTRVGC